MIVLFSNINPTKDKKMIVMFKHNEAMVKLKNIKFFEFDGQYMTYHSRDKGLFIFEISEIEEIGYFHDDQIFIEK